MSIWGSRVAVELANRALDESAGRSAEPGSVANVLRYLREARLCGEQADELRFDDVAAFGRWLDGQPEHQARIGLVEVFSGTVGDLAGVRGGDIVIVDPPPGGGSPVIGVAGYDGRLYNRGVVDVTVRQATVRVYRYLNRAETGQSASGSVRRR
ncbi:hypothetical protein [Prauserella shujinwangii]|uniref:hypothetical protein n=1 Tax=Prauserella shujinwangii TaxID=1453103 RepID=UPI000D0634DF|nr:hypothetical protein [Prauserella shujinwangii]